MNKVYVLTDTWRADMESDSTVVGVFKDKEKAIEQLKIEKKERLDDMGVEYDHEQWSADGMLYDGWKSYDPDYTKLEVKEFVVL